jgi:hypothetical protein
LFQAPADAVTDLSMIGTDGVTEKSLDCSLALSFNGVLVPWTLVNI